jgi:hypothetical protein
MDLVVQPGTFDDVPEEAQPSGERTFGRVVPGDEAQARAGARWAERIGVRRIGSLLPADAVEPSGRLAMSAALDPSHLPPAGRRFVARFRDRYGRRPGRYAAYGYEAMAVVLDSIERAGELGSDREQVIEAFIATADRDSVVGNYAIEDSGEPTLERISGYRIEDGRPRPIARLRIP